MRMTALCECLCNIGWSSFRSTQAYTFRDMGSMHNRLVCVIHYVAVMSTRQNSFSICRRHYVLQAFRIHLLRSCQYLRFAVQNLWFYSIQSLQIISFSLQQTSSYFHWFQSVSIFPYPLIWIPLQCYFYSIIIQFSLEFYKLITDTKTGLNRK